MVAFNKFLTSVLLAVAYASSARVSATPAITRPSTRGLRHVGRGLEIKPFYPMSAYQTFGVTGIDHPLAKRATDSLEDAALSFINNKLRLSTGAAKFRSGYTAETAKHAYLTQTHNDIPFANAVANVHFSNDDKVVAFGSSFVRPTNIADSKPTIGLDVAIAAAEKALNGQYNQHPATLEYLAKEDGTAVLTHVMQIRNEDAGTWYEAFVDAHSGELVSIVDFVSKASYRVLPITEETLVQGFQTVTNPQDTAASPSGWHTIGSTTSTDTSGNNVISYKGTENATTPQSSATLNFIYTQDPSQSPNATNNVHAARVNTFYIGNTVHDITYRYGFTEAAYNFQNDNFGKGGVGNDRVTISVQDSAGLDNSDFATPPDGQSGHMRMYDWDYTSPQRDGSFENDIVVHEYTHGVTNRMTGGGTGRCLQVNESGGLGEGWSDAMAEWTEQTSVTIHDYFLGTYVTNWAPGIRSHAYSTSPVTNPLRYSSLLRATEPHLIGEVWANMLHNVYASLVGLYGFDAAAKTNPSSSAGNAVFLHLFIDALALQPCNPLFPDARDAWIQADANRYGGVNKCLLWQVFASRGLGVGAANHTDSTSVPAGC